MTVHMIFFVHQTRVYEREAYGRLDVQHRDACQGGCRAFKHLLFQAGLIWVALPDPTRHVSHPQSVVLRVEFDPYGD